ncbi:MAG: hypothetical protein IKG40_01570 [Bacilli bacterium]|nr:hypothetical protein [Bacilli bacterium]
MKKFLKEHKKIWIIGGILLFLLVIVGLLFMIAPPISGDNYGHRLDEESKYKVTSSTINDIKSELEDTDDISKITYHKAGRVLNFTVTLEDGVVLDTAKKCADGIISKLSEKNLKYYDVQIFLDGSDDAYPIIGYHSKGSDHISWGNAGVK